ncbi:MAG: RecX family transcriptional regulator [Muribaculaceae bacterium]|nr:RecX family transcriptional regulator [Muribaculaceae bacterium]MBR3101806.1 RecX family transcriptional regulator [Muribaculaceae bacterium]
MKGEKKPISIDAALARAATLCSRGEQAVADVHDRLLRWGLSVADADAVVSRLKEENFLNEDRYAVAFVRDKFRFNGWGRIKLAYGLKQKQVSSQAIESALSVIDEEEYRARLLGLLQVKWRSVCNREPESARASLLRFAASRGFEPSVFYPAVETIVGGKCCDCCD